MIFTRGDVPSVVEVTNALSKFASWSGLTANCDKTEIYFGGLHPQIKQEILEKTGYMEGKFPFRYLGLPLNSSYNNADAYAAMIAKIHNEINHWSSKHLSYAGKITLLNSVVFGVEKFWCGGGLIPKAVIKKIDQSCMRFFWSIKDNHPKLVMKKWKHLCTPWIEGGMRMKELLSWNKSIIANWLDKLSRNDSGIWSKWNKLYNFPKCPIWEVTIKTQFSDSFRSIIHVKEEILHKSGSIENAVRILNECRKGGKFHTNLAYDWFRPTMQKQSSLKGIHGNHIIPRHGVICSMAFQNKLATVDNLAKRGFQLVNRCALCLNAAESCKHLFFKCSVSTEIWNAILKWARLHQRSNELRKEMYWIMQRRHQKHWKSCWYRSCLASTTYHIWKARNMRIFMEQPVYIDRIIAEIQHEIYVRFLKKGAIKNRMQIIHAIGKF